MRFFEAKVRILALPLLVFLLVLIISPSELEATRGECVGAYLKCMVSAGLLTLTNVVLAIGWAIGCHLGVIWCFQYFN